VKNYIYLLVLISSSVLSETITFECTFVDFVDQEGLHKEKKPLTMTYFIDGTTKKAYSIGSTGTSEVIPVAGSDQISFVEVTASGNVMTTTIVGTNSAVHSRNSVLFGELIPSQYYGSCVEK